MQLSMSEILEVKSPMKRLEKANWLEHQASLVPNPALQRRLRAMADEWREAAALVQNVPEAKVKGHK